MMKFEAGFVSRSKITLVRTAVLFLFLLALFTAGQASVTAQEPATESGSLQSLNLSQLFRALSDHLSAFSGKSNWSSDILVIAQTPGGLKAVFGLIQADGLTMTAAGGLSQTMAQAPPVASFFIRGVSKDSGNRVRALVVADISLTDQALSHFQITREDTAQGAKPPFQNFSLQIPDRNSPAFTGADPNSSVDYADNSEEYRAVFAKEGQSDPVELDLSVLMGDAAVPVIQAISAEQDHISFRYHCDARLDLLLAEGMKKEGMRLFLIPPVSNSSESSENSGSEETIDSIDSN